MAQNENISLSLGDRIDVLNKSQSLDARYGVYDSEIDALAAMQNYGLDGRQVAVYTDKPNGKVRLYLYNGVSHQLEPISGVEVEWDSISGDQSDVNISGFTNDSGFTTFDDLAPVATSNDYEDLDNLPSLLQLGETSTTAYRGDRGKAAYEHSQEIGNPHETTLQQVVDEDGTVEDESVSFTSATPNSPRVDINNEQVKIEDVTEAASVKIGFRDIEFEHGGNKLSVSPVTVDDDYTVVIQAKDHTLAGLDDIITDAVDIGYSNTTSELDAENVQDAIDEVQGNIEQEATDRQLAIETAGFASRTGTEIHFDKWATYDSYDSPSDGDFSYDLTNAVVGMIQVAYHEDSLVPTFTQVGITPMITGEYQPGVVNKIAFELVALDRILINIKAL